MFTDQTLLFSVRRDLPLEKLSDWELALSLHETGWCWELMPRQTQQRLQLPPHPTTQDTGTWYTLGKSLVRPYLLCLLQCRDLHQRFGINDVPHYSAAPGKFYQAMLAGKPISPEAPPRQRQAISDLKPECSDDEEPAPLMNVEEHGTLMDEEDDIFGPQLEDDFDFLKALEDAIEEEQLLEMQRLADEERGIVEREVSDEQLFDDVEEEQDGERGADGADGEDGEHSGDGADGEDDEVGLPAQPVEPVAGADDAEAPRAFLQPRGRLREIPWGCFTIARKRVSGQERAFECRCPFHRKNGTTNCKKTISYSQGNAEHALAAARWWCNQSLKTTTQFDHLKMFEDLMEVPFLPYDLLLEGQIVQAPVGHVKTDVEIATEIRAQSQGRGRGR